MTIAVFVGLNSVLKVAMVLLQKVMSQRMNITGSVKSVFLILVTCSSGVLAKCEFLEQDLETMSTRANISNFSDGSWNFVWRFLGA